MQTSGFKDAEDRCNAFEQGRQAIETGVKLNDLHQKMNFLQPILQHDAI
jgi:hypothetical protein